MSSSVFYGCLEIDKYEIKVPTCKQSTQLKQDKNECDLSTVNLSHGVVVVLYGLWTRDVGHSGGRNFVETSLGRKRQPAVPLQECDRPL